MREVTEFERELKILMNKHSMDTETNTPDFILAGFVIAAMAAFRVAMEAREKWLGRSRE